MRGELVGTGILIEGSAGAGKTKTLEAIREHPAFPGLLQKGRVYYENETLGDLLRDLKNPQMSPERLCSRLQRVLRTLSRASRREQYGYILERFHITYYVLFPDWKPYESIDHQLHALHCKLVQLHFDPNEIAERSLDRFDRRDTDWAQEIIEYFGSREHALQSMRLFQQRRRKCLSLSRLPHMEIDTTLMDWHAYAEQIIRFWSKG